MITDDLSRPARTSLQRVLDPRSIAIVGVSDNSLWTASAKRTLDGTAEVFFVHPTATEVLGRPCYPSLAAIGHAVDSVYSVVNAARTVELVEQAGAAGAGGVVTIAGGFAEIGPTGLQLQLRLVAAAQASGLALVGPNGVGFMNIPRRISLSMLIPFPTRPGGVSVVSHSGALIGAVGASAARVGGVGFNLLISAGNEAVTDMADYLDYLVADPATRIIVLAIEKIRRPAKFFAAAARARQAGKPVVALKLGRGSRAQRMAQSHTGSLTGDSWVYEVALRQANIQLVQDVDDLVDRIQLLEQLPNDRWSTVHGLAVITMTGGFAALASDLAENLDIDIPELTDLRDWLGSKIPGATVPNPLDATGFAGSNRELWSAIVDQYSDHEKLDSYLFVSQHAEWDKTVNSEANSRRFADGAGRNSKPYVIAPLAGVAGSWLEPLMGDGVAIGNGLAGSLRGFETMARFMRSRMDAHVADASTVAPVERPRERLLSTSEGLMLPFASTMRLLTEAGIPVCDFHLIAGDAEISAPVFEPPWVLKLADVPHRTEHGAVRVNVARTDLSAAVNDLRMIAARLGLPPLVAVQPLVTNLGEAFIGLRGASELGPVVAFGLGGILVEVLKAVGGRMAPFASVDALELIDEFTQTGILDGFRGGQAWDRAELARILVAAAHLAAGGRDWIESIDINPLIVTPTGYLAVDGLCLIQPV